jgi:hypothetical protein
VAGEELSLVLTTPVFGAVHADLDTEQVPLEQFEDLDDVRLFDVEIYSKIELLDRGFLL